MMAPETTNLPPKAKAGKTKVIIEIMNTVLIIGAGGVGRVVTHKCVQFPAVFENIWLASRTLEKCERIRDELGQRINVARIDADKTAETASLIRRVSPRLVINVALPYQDLSIMEACLKTGTDYLDTANYESRNEARFAYGPQWEYHNRFRDNGLMAMLGCGFDPGVTNVFCAYARKHHFDAIDSIDILDCNAGTHGKAFATNFNPEINIREITAPGRYYENGHWIETPPLSIKKTFDFPEIGPRDIYLLYHEELESLVRHIPGLRRIRFWMTFGDEYLTHLRVLQNVGMTSIEPVIYRGRKIVPLQFLKELLPDPGSLAAHYSGKTNIGCLIHGRKNDRPKTVHLYNVCDHAACYRETLSQAVSYTTGVPAMTGAMLMLTGVWRGAGVFNMEEMDPDPFMEKLGTHGLPWKERIRPGHLEI